MKTSDRLFIFLIGVMYLTLFWLRFIEPYLNVNWELIVILILATFLFRKEIIGIFLRFGNMIHHNK